MKECLCLTCGETNPDNFYVTKGYLRREQCKNCFNEAQKQKWKDNKIKAIKSKGNCCQQCGYDKYHGALEFHHLDPTVKEDNWGRKWQRSWKKIEESIEHTILLCANCHREEHERLRKESARGERDITRPF